MPRTKQQPRRDKIKSASTIVGYLKAHPTATNQEMVEATGLSYPTVATYAARARAFLPKERTSLRQTPEVRQFFQKRFTIAKMVCLAYAERDDSLLEAALQQLNRLSPPIVEMRDATVAGEIVSAADHAATAEDNEKALEEVVQGQDPRF